MKITLIHTNDLHSHLRPARDALGLGGVARLKTAIDRVRRQHPNSLLIDGGDFTEGNIYYNLGAGVETMKMMDHLGYDVAVVGNHDWLNGPDVLLDSFQRSGSHMSLIAANVDSSGYTRQAEFKKTVLPYVIKDVAGVKIAFIGLVTYEFVYDSFFRPIKITEPFLLAEDLATQLKKQGADLVVAVSHNSIGTNEKILQAAPDLDFVIGAHDHVKLTKPVVVSRPGHPDAWIVETGCWGQYLGQVDLTVTKTAAADGSMHTSVSYDSYKLTQMDSRIPEDPGTLARVEQLEKTLEGEYGPIFHDHVADSDVEVSRAGTENLMGDVTTDAYRQATGADVAVDQVDLIYGNLHRGLIRTVDVFNANPGIHSPVTGKSWTLHLIPVRGYNLQWLLNLLYSTKSLAGYSNVSVSGMTFTYEPKLGSDGFQPFAENPQDELARPFYERLADSGPQPEGLCSVCNIQIGGAPIDSLKTYTVAASGGIVEAFKFLDSIIPGAISLDQMKDTGQEDWRILGNYVHELSPLTVDNIKLDGRVSSQQADLGLVENDISAELNGASSAGLKLHVVVTVRNYGQSDSSEAGRIARVLTNTNGTDYSVDPNYVDLAPAQTLPSVPSKGAVTLEWDVVAPWNADLFPITVRLEGLNGEVNHSNDGATTYVDLSALRSGIRRVAGTKVTR